MQGHVTLRGVCPHGAKGSSRGSLLSTPSEVVVDLRLQTEYSASGFVGPADGARRGGRELGLDGGEGLGVTGGGAATTGGTGAGGVTTTGGAGGVTGTGGVFFGGDPGFVVGGGGGGDFLAGGPDCLVLAGTLAFLRGTFGFTGSRVTFFTGFN